jgi:hypothetical protein
MNEYSHVPLLTCADTVQLMPSGELVIVPFPFPPAKAVILAQLP